MAVAAEAAAAGVEAVAVEAAAVVAVVAPEVAAAAVAVATAVQVEAVAQAVTAIAVRDRAEIALAIVNPRPVATLRGLRHAKLTQTVAVTAIEARILIAERIATVIVAGIAIEIAIGTVTAITIVIVIATVIEIAGTNWNGRASFIGCHGFMSRRIMAAINTAAPPMNRVIKTACTRARTMDAAGKATIPSGRTFTNMALPVFARCLAARRLIRKDIATGSCAVMTMAISTMNSTSSAEVSVDSARLLCLN